MIDFMQSEFDRAWAKVNRHAKLPDDAREQIANAISWYLRLYPINKKPFRNCDLKSELMKLAKKADALFNELDRLSGPSLMTLIQFRRSGLKPLLDAHNRLKDAQAKTAGLRDWCNSAKEQLGNQRRNVDPTDRNLLIRAAAIIYEENSKQPFKDFPHRFRSHFIYEILKIVDLDKKNPREIDKKIRACCNSPLERPPTLEDIFRASLKNISQKK